MRLLILSQWYPPEPALMLQELAQSLIARGHDVSVLTGFPNYPSGTVYPGYRVRPCQREVLAGVPVSRVPLYPEHSRSGLRRALNYVSFALSAAALGPWLAARPDVMFVYHPPLTVGIPAYVLSRVWRVPFVYQVQDMWPETLAATGMLSGPRLLSLIGRFAAWVYRRAARILVISPGFRANLIAKGVPAGKIDVVPNWVDTDLYRPVAPDPAQAQSLGLADRFNIMYAGNMGEAQGLETLVEAARLLCDVEEIQFVFVGDGVALLRLKAMVASGQLRNVRFIDRHPERAMPGLYALADVLVLHLKDNPLFRITIPHKTMGYLACGKPVLAAVAGDAAEVVTSADAGIVCPPSDPVALAAAVRRLYALAPAERQAMGSRGIAAAHAHFSRERLVYRIEEALLAVQQEGHGGRVQALR
jgi:colanic acid biosynthesis glycosyl transferase WcaI